MSSPEDDDFDFTDEQASAEPSRPPAPETDLDLVRAAEQAHGLSIAAIERRIDRLESQVRRQARIIHSTRSRLRRLVRYLRRRFLAED